MIVVVLVSTEGTVREVLNRAASAVRDSKKLMLGRWGDVAVCGPRLGMAGGEVSVLQYRLSNAAVGSEEIWDRAPDEVVKAGVEYGAADR